MAGVSGASSLAQASAWVGLLEKAPSLRGRPASQAYTGYCFNRGHYACACGGAAARGLQEVGISDSGRTPSWQCRDSGCVPVAERRKERI